MPTEKELELQGTIEELKRKQKELLDILDHVYLTNDRLWRVAMRSGEVIKVLAAENVTGWINSNKNNSNNNNSNKHTIKTATPEQNDDQVGRPRAERPTPVPSLQQLKEEVDQQQASLQQLNERLDQIQPKEEPSQDSEQPLTDNDNCDSASDSKKRKRSHPDNTPNSEAPIPDKQLSQQQQRIMEDSAQGSNEDNSIMSVEAPQDVIIKQEQPTPPDDGSTPNYPTKTEREKRISFACGDCKRPIDGDDLRFVLMLRNVNQKNTPLAPNHPLRHLCISCVEKRRNSNTLSKDGAWFCYRPDQVLLKREKKVVQSVTTRSVDYNYRYYLMSKEEFTKQLERRAAAS